MERTLAELYQVAANDLLEGLGDFRHADEHSPMSPRHGEPDVAHDER